MKKIFLALTMTLISLNSFAITISTTGAEYSEGESNIELKTGMGAGVNAAGAPGCPACVALEKAGGVDYLSSTNGIFRANSGSTPAPNALPAIDPVNIGQ